MSASCVVGRVSELELCTNTPPLIALGRLYHYDIANLAETRTNVRYIS